LKYKYSEDTCERLRKNRFTFLAFYYDLIFELIIYTLINRLNIAKLVEYFSYKIIENKKNVS